MIVIIILWNAADDCPRVIIINFDFIMKRETWNNVYT